MTSRLPRTMPTRARVFLLVVVLGLSACGGDDDGESGAATSTTSTSEARTSTLAPAGTTTSAPPGIAYDDPSDPRRVGTGFVVGTSVDGSAAYVEEQDDAFDRIGCEGQPEPVLFRLPLDGRGNREPLGTPPPVRGTLVRGEGGRVALIDACEGFLSRVFVGREDASGRLRDVEELDLERQDDGPLHNPASFAWSADGEHLLTAENPLSLQDGRASVTRLDPDTGAATPLFHVQVSEGVFQVDQFADGSFVVAADGDVTVRDADGAVKQTVDGATGFAMAPDRRQVAAYSRTLTLLAPGGGSPSVLVRGQAQAEDSITSASFSPDGRALAYTERDGSENSVSVVTIEGPTVTPVVDGGPYGRTYFTGDGRALVFNRFESEPEFSAEVLVVRFG